MERSGQALLVLVDTGVNEIEAMYVKYRLEEAGYRVFVAGPKMGEKYVGRYGYPCATEATYHDVQARHFAGVICPGGWAPARLRVEGKVTTVVNDFFRSGKLVAAICHGGSVLISAGICRGLKMTGSPAILDDLRNAGAELSEGPVVIDRNVVTSPATHNLPAFMKGVLEVLESAVKPDAQSNAVLQT